MRSEMGGSASNLDAGGMSPPWEQPDPRNLQFNLSWAVGPCLAHSTSATSSWEERLLSD